MALSATDRRCSRWLKPLAGSASAAPSRISSSATFVAAISEGLPVIRHGGLLRVPCFALDERIRYGRVVSNLRARIENAINAEVSDHTALAARTTAAQDIRANERMTDVNLSTDMSDRQLLLTFRILRCAIVAAAVTLGIALVVERLRTGSLRGSISDYFYSPVRSIFVGGLMAIGVCLIAIQGKTVWEETSLNLAGLFAFVVALVPIRPAVCTLALPNTSQTFNPGDPSTPLPEWLRIAFDHVASGTCRLDERSGVSPDGLPNWVVTGVKNNVFSVMGAGAAALVTIMLLRQVSSGRQQPETAKAGRWALLIYLALLGVATILYASFGGIKSTSHYLAAGTMFGMFGFVVVINGWRRPDVPVGFRNQYRTIVVLMVLAIPLGVLASVYWLEAAEIILFSWFWVSQTVQIWNPERPGAKAILP